MSSVCSNVVSVLDNGSLGLSRHPFSASTPIDGLGPIQSLISTNRYSWSRDSKLLVIAGAQYVQVFSSADVVSSASQSAELLLTLAEQAVQYIEISPSGLWLVTWRKAVNERDSNAAVWCLRSGKCLLRRRQKVLDVSSNGVPFQFDVNEGVVWFLQGSEVLGFDLSRWMPKNGGDDADGGQEQQQQDQEEEGELKYSWRLHIAGITRFWISPSKSRQRMLVLLTGRKGAPSRVSMHEVPELDTAINSKSFFHADMVSVKWNTPGNCALVQATAAHDATGASYYGSSSLYLVSADAAVPAATICSSGSDGVVHDAQWNPLSTRKEFAVICGRRAFICSGKTGKATLDFGMQGWNTLSWSPNGRFLMVGGFGNMPGNLWFFDRIEKLLLGTASDHGAKPIGWSDDGRSLLLARLHPWRRVDNGFRIYDYSGAALSEFSTEKLYDVKFMCDADAAATEGALERPASDAVLKNAKPISTANLSEKKTQAYRPPKGRGTGSTGVNALLRQMRDQQDGGPRMVGASPVSMSEAEREAEAKLKQQRKQKNKERKARKKQEQADAAAAAALKAEEEAKAAKQAAKDAVPPAKRAKALTKKLRQIEALKKRQTDGEELDEDQMEKLSREEEMLSELKALGFSL